MKCVLYEMNSLCNGFSYLQIFLHVNYNTNKKRFKTFFENVEDFKLNYYVQHMNRKITYLIK